MSINANAEYNKQNTKTDDVVQGGDTVNNSYTSSSNEPEVPVEQPNDKRNPDSDETLGEYL
jgi:hypothetical protein